MFGYNLRDVKWLSDIMRKHKKKKILKIQNKAVDFLKYYSKIDI